MHQLLVLEAFKKAQKEIKREEPYAIANLLVYYIESTTGKTYTSRSLVSKYTQAKKGSNNVRLQTFLVQPLCDYLKYPNFEAFKKDHPTDDTITSRIIVLWRTCWFKFLLYNLLLLFIGIGIYNYALRERWMVWNDFEYIEVKFDANLYGSALKVYRKIRVENFKKIEPLCDYDYFNPDGRPRIWYGKDKVGTLQCFTDLALHPETGISLKPITQHMIDTYFCDKQEKLTE